MSPNVPRSNSQSRKQSFNLLLDVEAETGLGSAGMGPVVQTPVFVGWRPVGVGGDTGFVSRVCLTRWRVSHASKRL